MPSLLDAWFADRAPGRGKLVLADVADVGFQVSPVGGPIGVPTVFPPPGPTVDNCCNYGAWTDTTCCPTALPEPGTPLPGTPILAGMTGVGFTGSTYLHGLPIPTTQGTAFSLSVWLTFNPLLAPSSFTPDFTQGIIFNTNPNTSGLGASLAITPSWAEIDEAGPPTPPATTTGQEFPFNTAAISHFYHFMCAFKVLGAYSSSSESLTLVQAVAYVNDTQMANGVFSMPDNASSPLAASYFDASHAEVAPGTEWGANAIGQKGAFTSGLKCGMAEFWADWNNYVDWTVKANRLKFHNTDGTTYIPCYIGKNGAKPFNRVPLIYMTGNHTDFVYNRAAASTSATVVGTLIDIFDGFG